MENSRGSSSMVDDILTQQTLGSSGTLQGERLKRNFNELTADEWFDWWIF